MDYIDDSIFQVSVKGLYFNKEGKLLMIQEDNGLWEIPGGRVQKGEDLIESLRRECLEEMGVECEVLEAQPSIVYSALDDKGRARIMMYYKVNFKSLDIKPTAECVDVKFFDKEEIKNLDIYPQLKKLPDLI